MEESLAMIRGLKELGFEKLYATPHIMQDHYPNTPEIILQRLSEVKGAVKDAAIDIEIEAAAEYLMDEYFESKIQEGNLLTFPGKKVLIEMSFLEAPRRLNEYLFQLQTLGYKPILAHPERYSFLANDPQQYAGLKERGCLFQVNLLSLAGAYGKNVRKIGIKLLQKKHVEYLGSDLHTKGHVPILKKNIQNRIFKRMFGLRALYRNANL